MLLYVLEYQGSNMSLKLYNTLTRKKEEFKPLKGKNVGFYSCGITSYDYPHLGNYRAYVFVDILKRYLMYKGYKVNHIMNITDVDDKTIKGSRRAGQSLKDFTAKYEKAFFEDMDALNIIPANNYPKATEHIKEMVDIVKTLLKKKMAYEGSDGSIYYEISKFKDYGKLANLNASKLKAGASGRVDDDEYDKENVQDFALWKAWDKNDGDVFWDKGISKGRPGWHLECSAMSMKYLGKTFDIHCGGIDLVFPHHQNEIAQSEGSTSKKFVNYWLHNEWLLVNGQKMSKSLGNFFTLRDVLGKGHSPVAVRYELLAAHYRQQLNFTFEGLEAANGAVERLNELIRKLGDVKDSGKKSVLVKKEISDAEEGFEKAMDDDLNVSEALAVVFEFVKSMNNHIDDGTLDKKGAVSVVSFLKKIDTVLGVMNFGSEKLNDKVKKLIDKRESLRKEKKFDEADKIRDDLLKEGIKLDDTAEGVRWKKVN
jgi:cysteinyl-tRNA synthetase